MTTLSIGQFTALDLNVEEYIDNAANNGCQAVSVLVCSPSPQAKLPLVTSENLASVKSRLDATGLSILNVDCFMLTPTTDVKAWRPLLEIGAELGAKGATTLLYDADEQRISNNLKALCAMGRELGLRINIEYLPLSPRWTTLEEAAALIQQLAEPNLGLGIDLLHLIRSGDSPADLAKIPPELIYYVQLCDSTDDSAHKDYIEEAGSHRLAPGEGILPITTFLQALPANTPIEIEVPQQSNTPAPQRLKTIVSLTRQQIKQALPN